MAQYNEQLTSYAKQTNDALREILRAPAGCRQMIVIDAMRYSVLDSGKRMRAALVMEFSRLLRGSRDGATQLACAIEMIHSYSLIHDDLPCMDDDDMRRGKLSCHRKFGEANALLAGDGLLTFAFETAAKAPLENNQRLEAVKTLAYAAGMFGMIGGQVMDLGAEERQIGIAELKEIDHLKTGALLRAAAKLGCIAGKADEKTTNAADDYASAFGLAFQITDDILDVTGNVASLGKPIGSDIENNKTTYVSLLGLDGAREAAHEQIDLAKQSANILPDNGFLIWLADLMLERDH